MPAGAQEFLETLFIRGVSVKIHTESEKALVDIPQRCQYLTPDGLCGIYGLPERPSFCSRWPEEPAQLLNDPDCGFRFVWEED